MKPKLPGTILAPLRKALAADANVVCAWWGDRRLLVAFENVDGDVDDYREYIQQLSEAILPLLGPYGASLACGPVAGIAPSAGGGTLIYEREPS